MALAAEETRKHLKAYYRVGGTLIVLTAVTVAVAQLHFTVGMAVGVALLIACVKGSLVASFFMHLVSERNVVFCILGLCAVFFLALLLLPSLTQYEHGPGLIKFVDGVSGK